MLTRISRRAPLCDATGQLHLRTLHREEASALYAAGAIKADEMKGETIISFRLTAVRLENRARAGSFGIVREHLANGVVFAHQRRVYEEFHGQS